MQACCPETDFMFPMLADVYYPITDQNVYGQLKKNWIYDKTIALNATPVGSLQEDEVRPKPLIQYENILLARTKNDIRVTINNDYHPITNILITNIRTASNQLIYRETSGERSGRGTLYEIASQEPFTGAFVQIEFYKLVLRRTENQGVDD